MKTRMFLVLFCLMLLSGCGLRGTVGQATETPWIFIADTDFTCWTASAAYPNLDQLSGKGQIIVTQGDFSGYSGLYRVDPITQEQRQLVPDSASILSEVSPDGGKLWYSVFDSKKRTHAIFILDLMCGESYPLPEFAELEGLFIRWSADGQCLFIWDLWQYDTITAYRIADGATQQKVRPRNFPPRLEISPDGRWWAWICEGRSICIADPKSGQKVEHPALTPPIPTPQGDGPPHEIVEIGWSPGDVTLAVSYSAEIRDYPDSVRLIDLDENGVVAYRDLSRDVFPISGFRWSPDGKWLLVFDYKKLEVYDAATGAQLARYSALGGYTDDAAWSPAGDQIAALVKGGVWSSLMIFSVDTSDHAMQLSVDNTMLVKDVWRVFWAP